VGLPGTEGDIELTDMRVEEMTNYLNIKIFISKHLEKDIHNLSVYQKLNRWHWHCLAS
jgi:hypothetical protein